MIKKKRFKYTIMFLEDELYILAKSKRYTREIMKEIKEAIKVLKSYETGHYLDKQKI